MPPLFEEHDTRIVQHQNIYYNNHIHFSDLNNDGYSEKISLSTVNPDYSYVNFYDSKSSLSRVWNLRGQINNHSFKVGDYDMDQKKEIFLLTMYKDSLFLNKYFYGTPKRNSRKSRFITKIAKHFDKPDWDASNPVMKDLNEDGYKELIFSIYGKYSLQPRQLVIYDIKNDRLRKSRSIGTILKELKIITSPDDKSFFITANTSVTNYISDSLDIKYRDDKAWLLVYNREIEQQFEPYSFSDQGTIIKTYPLLKGDKIHFIALVTNHFNYKNSKLLLLDQHGKIINEKESNTNEYLSIFRDENLPMNQFYLMVGPDKVIKMNSEFRSLDYYTAPDLEGSTFYSKEIDKQKGHEIIHWIPERKEVIIYNSDFSRELSIKLPELKSKKLDISIKKSPSKNQVCFKDFNHFYLVSYQKSKLYPLKYLIYVIIYIIPFLILYAIQKNVALRRLKTERVISQLKLTSIKNQIDPHFTLNALNAIGSSILNDHKKESYEYLQRFSRLIRHSLTEADTVSRTLNDEVNFIKDYLEVLQIRYVDKFDYQIEIENDVDFSHQIPKMIIQSFVENAFNHGIKPKKERGQLKIRLFNYSAGLKAEVIDNGVGRDHAEKYKHTENTGKGISNINEYISIFNRYNRTKIQYRIIDMYEHRIPTGTTVIIYIPFNYDYRIN